LSKKTRVSPLFDVVLSEPYTDSSRRNRHRMPRSNGVYLQHPPWEPLARSETSIPSIPIPPARLQRSSFQTS
jgi:hypothetical protein